MNDISMFYPDFIANQVLTNTQLNNLRDYLDGQDRNGRIRLAGMGIICGLNIAHDNVNNTITVYGGYGLSSDGYLIEFETTIYRYVTDYLDPDSAKGVPNYGPWTTGNPAATLESLYLLSDDSNHPPLSTLDLSDFVVVLYLEREEVDLNSCLVTECDNKGINVNLTVRPLLLNKGDLVKISACEPLKAIRIPRLITELDLATVDSVNEIKDAYEILVIDALQQLESRLGNLKYLSFPEGLGIEGLVDGLVTGFVEKINDAIDSGDINQYHYDVIKDIAVAYNEAMSAFCAMVPNCFAANDFPRHLMLGAALKDEQGYRNEFIPSPFKNVFVQDEKRVYRLFGRLFAMLEKFTIPASPALRITPSQTERYPLGERAVPFYYTEFETAFLPNWQPQDCCSLKPLRSYHKLDLPGATDDLNFDYSDSSFLRIEGHLGGDVESTLNDLKDKRKEHNIEFGIVPVYIDDLRKQHGDIESYMLVDHRKVLDKYSEIQNFMFRIQSDTMYYQNGIQEIENTLIQIDEIECELGEEMEGWRKVYAAREPLCDYTQLSMDYAVLRMELLCRLHEIKKLFDDAKIYIKKYDGIQAGKLLTNLRVYMALHAMVLQQKRDWLINNYLPSEINETNFPMLRSSWREFYASLLMFCLLYQRAEKIEQGKLYGLGCGFKAPDLFLQGFSCFESRLSLLSRQYQALRENYINTLSCVAKNNPGMEHNAGVEPGGEFIVVCDSRQGSDEVVADFSLAKRLACCCDLVVDVGGLHGHAQFDFVVVKLQQEKNGSYQRVKTNIPVTVNDFELVKNANTSLYVDLKEEKTELDGRVEVEEVEPLLITYTHENPAPFAIDKFYYQLKHNNDETVNETGVVVVLHWFEEAGTGQISGKVITEVDSAMKPVKEAGIQLNEHSINIDSNEKGLFQFKDLPAGIHTIYASKVGYRTEVRTVELEEGEEDSIEIELQRLLPGTIKGWTQLVYKRSSVEYARNLPGVTVSIANSDIEAVVSSAAGDFSFDQIMPRKYTLETFCEKNGFRLKPKTRTIVLGETEVQEVYFKFTIHDFEAIDAANDLRAIALNEEYYAVAAANYLDMSYRLAQLREGMGADTAGTYADVERFTKEEVINPGLTNEEKQLRYEAVVQEIDKAMATAPAAEKGDYQAMLELASMAYLDMVAVSSTGMTAETMTVVDSVAANIKSAGIDITAFNDTWSRSASFSLATEGTALGMRKLIK